MTRRHVPAPPVPVGPCARCGDPLFGALVLLAHACCAFWAVMGAAWCLACAAAKTPSHGRWAA